MKFLEKLIESLETKKSHVCVGLDSRYDRIPDEIKKGRSISRAILEFNKKIVLSTEEFTSVYKSNVAFYAGFGKQGMEGLRLTNKWIRETYPNTPLIADCKRSEMGESVKMVKNEIFDWLGFDCVMVTPWFGFDTIRDYLDEDKNGVCVYVHDSNPTAIEIQDLELKDGRKVYEVVTQKSCGEWNTNGNVFVEAGATYPKQLKSVREIVGEEMVILTAGVGVQGGTIENLKGLFGKNGLRLLVNSSRGIIFAGENKKDYFEEVGKAARELRDGLRLIALK